MTDPQDSRIEELMFALGAANLENLSERARYSELVAAVDNMPPCAQNDNGWCFTCAESRPCSGDDLRAARAAIGDVAGESK